MALLLNDGFSLYGNPASALQVKGWTAGSNLNSGSILPGRATTSRSLGVNGGSGTWIHQTLAAFSGTTSVVGVAFYTTATGTLPADLVSVSVGGSAVRVVLTTSTSLPHLTVYKDSTLVADLTVLASGPWYYVELKVAWAAAGNVTVRLDGSDYYNAAITLAAPTAGLTVGLRNAFAGTIGMAVADLLVMDGSGSTFNDFQGDVINETLFPVEDGANTAWTARRVQAVTQKARTGNVATLTTGIAARFSVGDSVTIAVGDAAFDGTHTLTAKGAQTISFANTGLDVAATAVSTGTATLVTSVDRFNAVNEGYGVHNGDLDWVGTGTLNAVDTYQLANLATKFTGEVLAVRPVLIARKDEGGVAGIAPVVRSAGADYPGVGFNPPDTLYVPISDTRTVDPATGAAWTRAGVDAIEAGPKKTA